MLKKNFLKTLTNITYCNVFFRITTYHKCNNILLVIVIFFTNCNKKKTIINNIIFNNKIDLIPKLIVSD